MTCDAFQDFLINALAGELDQATRAEFQIHIVACSRCREEWESLCATRNALAVLPDPIPSQALRASIIEKCAVRQPPTLWRSWGIPVVLGAAATLLIMIGAAFGVRLAQRSRPVPTSPAAALLTQASASQRRAGLFLAERDDLALAPLLLRLVERDPEPRVRLAAVRVLAMYIQDPAVTKGVLEALPRQQDPEVQAAMTDLLLNTRERRTNTVLIRLLRDRRLQAPARGRVEQGSL